MKNIEEKNFNGFNITKNIGNYFYVDENSKLWTIPKGIFKKKIEPSRVYSYGDIVDYELIEDGNTISNGGVGRAIVGGALFGGVGAIVGGATGHKNKETCTKLQIKITLNNVKTPTEYITFILAETKKDSFIYKTAIAMAQEIISLLQIICNENKNQNQNVGETDSNQNLSNIDKIKKYKELLDCGAITEEEFNNKKKELLNI